MKHKINFSLLLLFCSSYLFAQHTLEITVANIKETTGTVRVALYANEDDFLKKFADGRVIEASAKEVTVIFTNLKPGTYAVSTYHDVNGNDKMDSIVGIPTEPYGFSNNVMGMFGPPSFDKAKVKVEENTKSVINLR
jgi:uncharacterized protein (DUF2141 family)